MRAQSEMLCFCWASRTTERHFFPLSLRFPLLFRHLAEVHRQKALIWVCFVWPQWLCSFFGCFANQTHLKKCNLKVNSFRLQTSFASVTNAFQRFWCLSACLQQEIFLFKIPQKKEICPPHSNPIWEECYQEWISNWNMWKADVSSFFWMMETSVLP